LKVKNQKDALRQNRVQGKPASGRSTIALATAIILIAANLRAPLTSVSPLLEAISRHLGMSHPLAGAVTTLPLAAFAVFSLVSPRLSSRWGLERVLLVALAVLATGLLLRPWRGTALLLAGTLLAGTGIAVCNVLLPVLISRRFPKRLGILTGMYTVSMNLTGAVASAMSIPLSRSWGWGWQWTLFLWGGLAGITALYWLFYILAHSSRFQPGAAASVQGETALWRYKLSWQIALYLGLQSFSFYAVMAWLPHIAAGKGIDAGTAGWMVSLMQLAGLPFNFVVPLIAVRVRDQRLLAMMNVVMFAAGIACLFADSAVPLAVGGALLGSAAGSSFSLSMIFFNLRTSHPDQASRMSGMAQSVGYLLACTGPVLFGWLHDWSGGWHAPLYGLAGLVVLFAWAGLGAGRNVRLPVENTVQTPGEVRTAAWEEKRVQV
jgi:CP family cyanate transporter-like MFS transporter